MRGSNLTYKSRRVDQQSRTPAVCVSSMRVVIGSSGNIGLRTSNPRTSFTSASRATNPRSQAWRTATPVTVFETEATLKMVSGRARSPVRRLSVPNARAQTTRPPNTLAALTAGSSSGPTDRG
jgi:hypothetical protein